MDGLRLPEEGLEDLNGFFEIFSPVLAILARLLLRLAGALAPGLIPSGEAGALSLAGVIEPTGVALLEEECK